MEDETTSKHDDTPPPGYESGSEADSKKSYGAKMVQTHQVRQMPNNQDPRVLLSFKHQHGSFQFPAVADSGTSKTIISKEIAKKHNMKLYSTDVQLTNASNESMKCEGRVPIRINSIPAMALVSSLLHNDILLSLKDMMKLGIVSKDFPSLPVRITKTENDFETVIESICKEFDDVISDTLNKEPMAGPEMTIHLMEGAIPTKVTTARKTPIHWLESANDAINKLIDQDVLQVEKGPMEWIARGFFVPKGSPEEKAAIKSGLTIITVKDLRLVVDFTGLNKYVRRRHWPFPSCQDVMDQIDSDSKYFATMDCTAGYHQIKLD